MTRCVCGKENLENATYCQECGNELTTPRITRNSKVEKSYKFNKPLFFMGFIAFMIGIFLLML